MPSPIGRPLRNQLAHLHPRRKWTEQCLRAKQHTQFLRELREWQRVFFAVKSQLDPERLARFVKAGDPYALT